MLKKYLSYILFLIIGGVILSPLNTFAGTLTNISVVGDSNLVNATTTYTFSYTTESDVSGGYFNYIFEGVFNSGDGFTWNNVQTSDVSVTVNGVSKSVLNVSHADTAMGVILNQSVPGGSNVVVTVHNVVNANHAGTFGFFAFKTMASLTTIDSGNPSIVIVAPDTTAPTITNISSDKANGYYKAGEVVDIDVTFSEAVTSTGDVTVTLETGDVDRTCTFSVTSSTTGTCNYTVQAGDTSSDLTVVSVSGTIADGASNAMSNFVPTTNLAANKAIVIDTTVLAPGVNIPFAQEVIRTPTYTTTGTCETGATVSISNIYLQTNPTTVVCSGGTFSASISFLISAINTPIALSYTQTDLASNVSSATVKNVYYALQTGSSGGDGGLGLSIDMGHGETQAQNDTQSTPPAEPTSSGSGVKKSVDTAQKESPEPIKDAPVVISPAEVIAPKKEVYTFSADITRRRKNNIQDVTMLQKFLNKHEGNSLDLTGVYDIATEKAINRFQLKYASEILTPWNINYATGNVAIYTRKKINAFIAENGV